MIWIASIGCARTEAPKAPTTDSIHRPDAFESDSKAKIRWEAGEVVDLKIPLVDGIILDLHELRGRQVIIELSDQNRSQIEQAQMWFRSAARGREQELMVVQVVVDDTWIPPVDIPNLRYSWDPDGAIAASLRSKIIPTLILIDKQGRLKAVLSCRWPTCVKQLRRFGGN